MPTTRKKAKTAASPSRRKSVELKPKTAEEEPTLDEEEEEEDAEIVVSMDVDTPDRFQVRKGEKSKEEGEDVEEEPDNDEGEGDEEEEEEKVDGETEAAKEEKVLAPVIRREPLPPSEIRSSKVLLHHCRFYEWMPDSINSISFNRSGEKVAVARSSSNVEIWATDRAMSSGLRLETIIAGDGQQVGLKTVIWASSEETNNDDDDTEEKNDKTEGETEAETIRKAWAKRAKKRVDRLFTGGLNGFIVEWDLKRLTKKNVVQSYGGAVWDIASNAAGTRLAVACEDGSVRLFDITDGGLNYYRSFAGRKRRKRVLAVAWHPETDDLWSSSVDGSITRHNIETAVDYYRVSTDHRYPIWAIKVLRDNTVVSGSRSGHTQFWDGNTGTLLQSFTQHTADVVALAASSEGDAVFSSGVDHKVSLFIRLPSEEADGIEKWVFSDSHRTHTHDVKALALYNSLLLSGGVDTQLVVMPFTHTVPVMHGYRERRGESQTKDFNYAISQEAPSFKIPPYPPGGLVSFSGPSKRVLLQFTKSLQLWQLGTMSRNAYREAKSTTQLEPETGNEMLAELNLTKGRNLRCSALSPNGNLIACSDSGTVKLFKVSVERELKKVQRLKVETTLTPSHRLVFSSDSKKLILATQDCLIQVYDLVSDRILKSFPQHQGLDETANDEYVSPVLAPITHLEINENGHWLASCDTLNRIHVFDITALHHHFAVPRLQYHTTALGFQPRSNVLGIVCETQHVFFYDLLGKGLTDWSQKHSLCLPADYLSRKGTVFRLAFNPHDINQVILASNGWVCYLHLLKNVLSDSKYKEMSKKVGALKHRDTNPDRKGKGKGGKNFAEKAAANAAEILEHKDPRGNVRDRNFIFLEIFRPLIDLSFINNQELVAVERSWLKILQALPDPLYRPRYRA